MIIVFTSKICKKNNENQVYFSIELFNVLVSHFVVFHNHYISLNHLRVHTNDFNY